jgi:hypothetical protein
VLLPAAGMGWDMASGPIQGYAFDLNDLFGQASYKIEYYQREYAWSAEDIRTLITDLFEAFDRSWQEPRALRGGRGEHYFLGPFVYVQQDSKVRFLVDGQQRFTTLHLLFLHLRQMAGALQQRPVENRLEHVITSFATGDHPRFRIEIEERQRLLEALYWDRPYELPSGSSLSVRNLHDRSRQIGELIAQRLDDERLKTFVDWLLSKVIMVGIRAPGRDSGFRIFESMNDRGARLTSVDLLKSFLLSNVGEGEEKLNQRWRHMLAELTGVRDDPGAPQAFLKAVLLARYAPVDEQDGDAGADIEAGLNIWVRKNTELLGLRRSEDYFRFTEELIELARHYRTFLQASRGFYQENGLQGLYYNQANGLTNQMALVLAAVRPTDTDTSAKEKAGVVANFLDRLFVERVLDDEPVQATAFDDEIRRLVPRLRACATREDVCNALSADLPAMRFASVTTFGMRGNNKAQVRYLLARLTAYVETGLLNPNRIAEYLGEDRAWQIEHLYANHRERHGDMDLATFRALRARLGVLVLLHRSDNASYNDLPLDEKRRHYARQNGLAAILSPDYRKNRHPALRTFIADNGIESGFREFGANDTLEKVVEVRGELYRRLCERVWAPAALGFPEPPHTPDALGVAESAEARPARRRALTTNLARMVRANVLAPESEIEGEYKGMFFRATVDGTGAVVLPSGDAIGNPDVAGKLVRGTRTCIGMDFWHTVINGERLSLRELYSTAKQKGLI